MKNISNTWKIRYLQLAKQISKWSKDPSTKVGAVVVGNYGQILSQGYNGFPRGFDDDENIYKNRSQKYDYIIHAEMNCIYHATVNKVSLEDSALFVYGLDICHECAKAIIQVGIKQVYTCSDSKSHNDWLESFEKTKQIFKNQGVLYEKVNSKSII